MLRRHGSPVSTSTTSHRSPLFSACSKKELQARRPGRPTRSTVDAGQGARASRATSGREAFVIVDGTAEVRRNGRKVATLGPGDCFGELALLDHGPRTATVIADTDMTVLVLGAARVRRASLDEVPAIAHKLLAALAGRVRELDTKTYG